MWIGSFKISESLQHFGIVMQFHFNPSFCTSILRRDLKIFRIIKDNEHSRMSIILISTI